MEFEGEGGRLDWTATATASWGAGAAARAEARRGDELTDWPARSCECDGART
jgi:hypothetical protein